MAQAERGRVGVNATAPTERLHVNGTARIQSLPKAGEGVTTSAAGQYDQTKANHFDPKRVVVANAQGVFGSMPGAWRYDQRHQVQNDNRLSDGASRPFTDLWALTYLSQDAEGLAVGNWISVRTMRSMRQGDHYATQFMVPAAGRTESLMLTAPSAFRVRKDAEVPFGKVLQQWQNGPAFAQLILREGSAPDEAALCWNYALPAAGRVFCQHWQVPAQWQAGKPLVDKGAYIDDDREFYPGESGHRFWRWEAASGQGQ